jgi:polysaccharide pyruvyl transferase WcaK-like protein
MTLRNLTQYGPIEKTPMEINTDKKSVLKILHIGVHNSANLNAGDTLLFPIVRKLFDSLLGPFDWELKQAWEELTLSEVERVNAKFDGIVLGGGGLILSNQEGSDISNSGWQWNSTVKAVQSIEIPLIVFAIGYNRFRNQSDFSAVFSQHINNVIAKSSFFGLRNYGSISKLSDYVKTHNIKRQFCPTTVLWQLYPEFRKLAKEHDKLNVKNLAVNIAFDRSHLRFKGEMDEILIRISCAMKKAQTRGWKIVVVSHKTLDRGVESYLDSEKVDYDSVDLTEAGPNEIMRFYSQTDFVVGMRGHSQMIPFGLRRPIMSIISHDKMKYFLDDINRREWGVEINSHKIVEEIDSFLDDLEKNREVLRESIKDAQEFVWEETLSNMQEIGFKNFGIKSIKSEINGVDNE